MRTWDNTRRRPTRKAELRANGKRWYAENADRHKAARKAYREANPEKTREQGRQLRARNRETIAAWARSEPGRAARNRAEGARRARKRGAQPGDPKLAREYRQILIKDPCCYCGAPMEHVDHIVPVVHGGTEDWFNLTAACGPCNSSKHTRDVLEFLMTRR